MRFCDPVGPCAFAGVCLFPGICPLVKRRKAKVNVYSLEMWEADGGIDSRGLFSTYELAESAALKYANEYGYVWVSAAGIWKNLHGDSIFISTRVLDCGLD